MSLPQSEIVTSPSGEEFFVWVRDSGIHIDCSIDAVVKPKSDDTETWTEYQAKYHGHNDHPSTEKAAETHFATVKAKIEAGEEL